jgi:hypothetical protein
MAGSGMTVFAAEIIESCRSLGIKQTDIYRALGLLRTIGGKGRNGTDQACRETLTADSSRMTVSAESRTPVGTTPSS